jgi:uncharacterized protein with ParB-like and HNH nuclease domain
MRPSIQTLGQILYSPSQYVVPVFQRNYRWESPQWAKLWNSLIDIQSPDKSGNHFMGFLVFVPGLAQPGQHTTFHLIDGQQRLMTSSILLAAIRNVARNLDQDDLASEIHEFYLVHPLKKNDQHYRLLPKERDHDSFIAIVSGNGSATGRTADALDYFEEQLLDHASEAPERLRQLFDTVCQRFEFMCATLEADNAYNIFKSLNSTGVPLGASDLIRNFVFMHVVPDDHDEFDRELWGPLEDFFARDDATLDEERFSKFFRDFLMADGRYVSPKDTFATFEARFEATAFSPKLLTEELIANVRYYAVISGEEPDSDDEVTDSLAGLNMLDSSTTYPLLLALFGQRTAGTLSSKQLSHGVEMLRGFILRRFVTGLSSRGYGQMFVRAVNKGIGNPVDALEAYLLDRGWPDDHQFRSALVHFPLYQRGYAREVLETLERARGHKEPADLLTAQIEHVLPQTLNDSWIEALGSEAERIQADWLHRLGNLTLSGYNPELWNHGFEKKRARYEDSNIVLTREISEEHRWGEEEIQARGERLAEEAVRIWAGPVNQIARPEQDSNDGDGGVGRRELRQHFWRGLNDYLVAEHPELPDFDPRPVWTIRLPSSVRHIGFEMRLGLRQGNVGIDVWFWREASLPVWDQLRQTSDELNQVFNATWEFERLQGQSRARMSINHDGDVRNELAWPDLYRWMGWSLTTLFSQLGPKLRNEMDRAAQA